MNRRDLLQLAGATASVGVFGRIQIAAAATPTMTSVVKIIGIPYFNQVNEGFQLAGKRLGIQTSMVGPTHVDPAQQVSLVEDVIAKRVDVLGLVPLDEKVLEPVVKRARDAGIVVITSEAPSMNGRDWDVEMMNTTAFGQAMMESLAKQMGGEGEYICIVGTLTTPLHNLWCDAAIAYQKARYPKMKMATSRFPGADEVDDSEQVVREALQAYPDLRGVIGFGSNGPIGAGNVSRQRHLQHKLSITGFTLPSQVKPLIEAGAIKEGFFYNPIEVGEAMVGVASLVLSKTPITSGVEVPGLGKATVDQSSKVISVNRMLVVDKNTVDGFIAQGL